MKHQKVCFVVAMALLIASIPWPALPAEELNSSESHAAMEKLLRDYISLYRKESLAQWKELFHPSVTIIFPADDGTITVRNLAQFFVRQQDFFAQRKSVSERLENVQIAEGRRMSRVLANFVFVSDGAEKRGKLGLHLLEGNEGWKIVGLVFSYDQP